MEQTDLRIGNLLNYPKYYRDGGDKIWSVRELSLDSPLIGLTDGRYQTKVAFKPLFPIPLTEEWLNKFGFDSGFSSDPQEPNASKVHRIKGIEIHQIEEIEQRF